MPPLDVFAAALRALDSGRGVAIAAVTGASGSTPRHLGARMVVAADGEQWGTIGGGRIARSTRAARRRSRSARARDTARWWPARGAPAARWRSGGTSTDRRG